MIRFIQAAWYRRLRRIDLEIVWPAGKKAAQNIATAREMFLYHTSIERAWQILGDVERRKIVKELH